MANRGNKKFPRNNNNFNCHKCGQKITIIDGNVGFSINLHMKTHEPIDNIAKGIDKQFSKANFGPNVKRDVLSSYSCPECHEAVQIVNNDIKHSLEVHAQKHQNLRIANRGDDQSSTSSNRSKGSNRRSNYVRSNPEVQSEDKSVLDNIFNKMQPGLKSHRGFVFENESGEFICGLCNLKIDSLYKTEDHLKTKSHEDNVISFIKSKLPFELKETMEFLSFYGSNLCCNLCRCKIDLCSFNISETIVNIMAHNAGRLHVNKRGSSNDSTKYFKEGMKMLNCLASMEAKIDNNKHLISFETQPQFKCKLCDKLIPFDQNEKALVKNFVSHFMSKGHEKCLKATSVLTTFKSSYHPKDVKHNLTVSKGTISCTSCNVSMEPSLVTLNAHTKEVDNFSSIDWPVDLSARFKNIAFENPRNECENSTPLPNQKKTFKTNQPTSNIKPPGNDKVNESVPKLNVLLKSMPPQYRNINYVVESSQGQVTCLICNCVIPATHYNLKTHLTGNSHSKNEQALSGATNEPESNGKACSKNPSNTSAQSQNLNPFLVDTKPDERRPPYINSATSTQAHSFNPFMKETSLLVATDASIGVESATDKDMLNLLSKNDSLIRRNKSLLKKHDDNIYSCKLCQTTIPKAHDMDSLKLNLLGHLSKPNHKKNYNDKQEAEINKLLTLDPLVRANKSYLLKQEESLLCTLCDSDLTISIDGMKLKKNLTEHLKGQQHLSNSEKVVPNSPGFMSSTTENFKGPSTPSKEEFTKASQKPSDSLQNLFEELKGLNFGNVEKTSSLPQKLPNILPNPNQCLKEEHLLIDYAKHSTSDASKPLIMLPNPVLADPVKELFNKLPQKFQSDIAFIGKSNVVDGFLSCTLCNTNHINPPYLQNHLEEERHLKGKLTHSSSPERDSQNVTSSQKVMRNMKSFFGISK